LNLFVAPFQSAIVRYSMLGYPGVRAVDDKRGQFLEFAATNTFAGRYDGYSVIPYGVRVWVVPHIRLEPFVYPPGRWDAARAFRLHPATLCGLKGLRPLPHPAPPSTSHAPWP